MSDDEAAEIGFLAHFARLEDPRQAAKTLYPLNEVLMVSLCAAICGADSWVEVARFGKLKLDFLRRFLPFKDGVPSHDTFGDVFSALAPEPFKDCFVAWTAALARHIEGVVAIDGKTLRRSFDRANGQAAIHMVSAWSSSQHLVLGQERVADKSNEITAIPKLLDLLSLAGAIVTIDAIGCQTAIARKIIDQDADYVLALMGYQGNLHRDIELFFQEQVARDFADARFDHHATADADHGRIEERDCWVTDDIDWLKDLHDDWPALRSIVMIRARRTLNGKTSTETRYFISSLAADARQLAEAVRAHWGIENRLHWVLDMTFRDDESRIRKDHAPHNATIIKHMALNMLKKTKGRDSIRVRRKSAGWDNQFLQSVLMAA
jgi:predicted transposase YbfD/YdcC